MATQRLIVNGVNFKVEITRSRGSRGVYTAKTICPGEGCGAKFAEQGKSEEKALDSLRSVLERHL